MNNVSDRQKAYNQFKNIAYYLIIGIVSVLATMFIPMLGSEIGIDWNWPTTTVGWCVWVLTKLIVGVINILIFFCFMEQAKVNVKDDPNYIKANEILHRLKNNKEIKPRSPASWNAKQYLGKGTSIFLTSILSAIGLANAVLTFDLVSFLTYLFTILMGLVFGYLQMRKAESYWTDEYLDYALMLEHDGELANKEAFDTYVEYLEKVFKHMKKEKNKQAFDTYIEYLNKVLNEAKTLNTEGKEEC